MPGNGNNKNGKSNNRKIAYFSMEIALKSDIPTYSGGLGVLAGDTLRSAADLEIPMVGVTICYSSGYFYQMIDPNGSQIEKEIQWDFKAEFGEMVPEVVTIMAQGRPLRVGAWKYELDGFSGYKLPVYLLTTNIDGNDDGQRALTQILYNATPFQRVMQELILGVGGVRMLKALGHNEIDTYHMNEGHAAFLTLELLKDAKGDKKEVKKHCIFTTHTPVPAGHDRFPYDMVRDVFRDDLPKDIVELGGEGELNMTKLALNLSKFTNGVSKKHGEVSKAMFPKYDIDSVTNGIHVGFWLSPHIHQLYNKHLKGWQHNYRIIDERAAKIDPEDLETAHNKAKQELIDYEKSHSWLMLDNKLLTIGFARRVTPYKRPALLLRDVDRLGRICGNKVQFVFAGKTHPNDGYGKDLIRAIYKASDLLWSKYRTRVVFLENYDMDLAHLMVSGVDVWMNNPVRYQEASGTSGMKAAANGVINWSVLDGWWIEAYKEDPVAGFAIGPAPDEPHASENNDEVEANNIYNMLENDLIPMYYQRRAAWLDKMRHAIKLAGYFNTHRMCEEYADKAWKIKRQERWKKA